MDLTQLTPEQKRRARAKIESYQQNPRLFFSEVIGTTTYWDKQLEIIDGIARHKKVTVRSGHDVGKSFVAADIALWFLYCFSPSIVITTAPTWRQVEKVLWGEMHAHHSRSKIPLGGKILETEIKLGPKWYAIGFSSDSPDSFQGFHEQNILVIVDEPSGVEDKTFEAIESTLGNQNARLLMIGNPVSDRGYFKDSFTAPGFHKIHIDCLDSPNVKANKILFPGLVTKEWCDERREAWGEDSPMYQARVRGNFPTESDDTLIKMDWISRSGVRWDKFKEQPVNGPSSLNVDVARFGSNNTVLTVKIGRRVQKVVHYRGYDLMHTVSQIRTLDTTFNFDEINIDDNGMGGGVTDRLKELGFKNVNPINAGAAPDDKEKFYDRRSELSWRVREALRNNELDLPPDCEQLFFECNNQFYDLTSDNRIRVMSKTLLKKKGLASPDFFDSLCLAFAREMPLSLERSKAQYMSEFVDRVHIVDLQPYLDIGVSRFMVMATVVNGPTALLWAVADRKGMVYFYQERLIYRASSSSIHAAVTEAEKDSKPVDERYTPRLYPGGVEVETRYHLLEQLEDLGTFFEEVDFNPEVAGMNLREGLRFDPDRPINNSNHPYVLFHPSCEFAARAVKYYLDPTGIKNDPVHEAFHKAIGTLILTEPVWLKVYDYV